MIIKTFSRKSTDFTSIIHYIANEHKAQSTPLRFHYHLPSTNLDVIIQAFQENLSYQAPRKNGNIAYHSILSFHEKDQTNLSKKVIIDLVHQYIKLRGMNTLYFGQLHQDQDHPHIHLLHTANQYKSSKATRLSRTNFYQLRADLEAYQVLNYPQLQHSLVYQQMQEFPIQQMQKSLLPIYEKAQSLLEFKQLFEDHFKEKAFLDLEFQLIQIRDRQYNLIDLGVDLSIFDRLAQLQALHQKSYLERDFER